MESGGVAVRENRMAAFAGKWEAFGQTKVAALKAAVAQGVAQSQQMFEKEKPAQLTPVEQDDKVKELRASLGPLPKRARIFCSDACLRRYLRARNWHVQRAERMLRDTLKWRDQCRPEEIRWADVAEEGATGKVYRTAFQDKHGRPVVVLSAGQQNTNNHAGQVRHLVHCLENAVMNLPATAREQQQPQQQDGVEQGEQQGEQEQMVWLIDFRGWSMRKAPPLKTSREVLSILQSHYPERLGAAVIYNPPAVFEAFWKVIRPFIDPVTFNKILFVNPSKPDTVRKLEGIFDLDRLEEAFGGRSKWTYDHATYGEMMARDDEKTAEYWGIVEGERLGQQQEIVGDESGDGADSTQGSEETRATAVARAPARIARAARVEPAQPDDARSPPSRAARRRPARRVCRQRGPPLRRASRRPPARPAAA
ncbi:unnamed protein product [Closterium sp. NIES-64]|nr:unnamed protein product [Closterium sp. NIES-64]